jgi:hypothetical protein
MLPNRPVLFRLSAWLVVGAVAAGCATTGPNDDDATETSDDELSSTRELIADVARASGEYFRYEETRYAANVALVPFAALPDKLRAVASERLAAEEDDLLEHEGKDAAARFSDVMYKIVNGDGRAVGYVIAIEHDIGHPLWDGSGVYVFYDTRRNVVTETRWTG